MKLNRGENLLQWLSRPWLNKRYRPLINLTVFLAAPLLAALTYLVLGPFDRGAAGPALRLVLLADFIYVMAVVGLIVRSVTRQVIARRAHSAGAQLHLRLTGIFALVALLPSILIAAFAMLTINIGLEGWFSERVRNVLDSSAQAAQAYAEEHRTELRRDAQLVADFLNQQKRRNFYMNDADIRQVLGSVQSEVEYLISETFVLDGTGEIRVRGGGSYEFNFERPNPEQIRKARNGQVVLIEDKENDEFRALLRLALFSDRYLQVSRVVDGEILALLDDTVASVDSYDQLEKDRTRLLIEFGLIYLGFALILVSGAVWLGLQFAERLSKPVGRLLSASQKVGAGNLDVQVPEGFGGDEISSLSHHFNEMTEKLREQREELMARTDQIESRRRQFDSVLNSVTSGVVGLDSDGRVTFVNRSAETLLGVSGDQSQRALVAAVPEFGPLFDRLRKERRKRVQQQVSLLRGGKAEELLVRMSPRRAKDGALEGYVVAFDDVTDLVVAQRTAAWGDVARRIAHEIKNPLTPIQLSAERIKRKFAKQVENPSELEQMTDVIVRQTNDLRRIVDEFSKFARMPEADKTRQDLVALLRDAVTLQQSGLPQVSFNVTVPEGQLIGSFDATMISQMFNNLIKNAGEAIDGYIQKHQPEGFVPKIEIELEDRGDHVRIAIADNGLGLPDDRSKLLEPYVTTRAKGTGLGLPIVKKIIEEHGGSLELLDNNNEEHGAIALVRLPLLPGGDNSNEGDHHSGGRNE